jgi:hypothetical protein
MPDPHRIAGELFEILQNKRYNALLMSAGKSARQFADEAAAALFRSNALVDPVTVEELKGPVELYRAYDGISKATALTLGSFWCDRALVESMWSATSRLNAAGRPQAFFDFFRSAMFVHPQWNLMTDIACMRPPAGNTLPVFKGQGNWRALRASAKPSISSQGDVIDQLHWMPIPGPHQYMVPGCKGTSGFVVWAFNDMWVSKVPKLATAWPLWS